MVLLGLKVIQADQGHLVQREIQVMMVLLDSLEQRVLMDLMGHVVQQEALEGLVLLVLQGLQERVEPQEGKGHLAQSVLRANLVLQAQPA